MNKKTMTFEELKCLPYSQGKALLLDSNVDLTELLRPGSDDLQHFVFSPYCWDLDVLKHVSNLGLPIAFHLCSTDWVSTPATQELEVLSIQNEFEDSPMLAVRSGDTVGHYLARISPRWPYTEAAQNEAVLMLTTPGGVTVFEELVEHRHSWATTEAAQDSRYMKIIDKTGEYIVFQLIKKWNTGPATQDINILSIRERRGDPEQRLAVVSYLCSSQGGYGWHLWRQSPAAVDPQVVSIKYKSGKNALPVAMYLVNDRDWVKRITSNDTQLLNIIDENSGTLLAHLLAQTNLWAEETLKLDEHILTKENNAGMSVLDIGCSHFINQKKYLEYFKTRLSHKYKDGLSFAEYAAIQGVNLFDNGIVIPSSVLKEPVMSNKEMNLNIAQHYVLFTPKNNAAKIIFLMGKSGMHIGSIFINDFLRLSEYETIVFNENLQKEFGIELDMLLKVLPRYCESLLDASALTRFTACIYASIQEVLNLVGKDVSLRYTEQVKQVVGLFTLAIERCHNESVCTAPLLADLPWSKQLAHDINAKLEAKQVFSSVGSPESAPVSQSELKSVLY